MRVPILHGVRVVESRVEHHSWQDYELGRPLPYRQNKIKTKEQQQMLITDAMVGPDVMEHVKRLLLQPRKPSETMAQFHSRLHSLVARVPMIAYVLSGKIPKPQTSWRDPREWEVERMTWCIDNQIKLHSTPRSSKKRKENSTIATDSSNQGKKRRIEHPACRDKEDEVEIILVVPAPDTPETIPSRMKRKSRWSPRQPCNQEFQPTQNNSITHCFAKVSEAVTQMRVEAGHRFSPRTMVGNLKTTGLVSDHAPDQAEYPLLEPQHPTAQHRAAPAKDPLTAADHQSFWDAPLEMEENCTRTDDNPTQAPLMLTLEPPGGRQDPMDDVLDVYNIDELAAAAWKIVPKKTKAKDKKDLLPMYRDANGEMRVINWSRDNMARISKVSYAGLTKVYCYREPANLRKIAGQDFKTYQGSRDLFELPNLIRIKTPHLMDEARNALNSSREANVSALIETEFCNEDFTYNEIDGKFSCRCGKLPDIDFSAPNQCLLRDQLAMRLEGTKVPHGSGYSWVFESPMWARRYLLLCFVVLTADELYFKTLHKRSRRKYCNAMDMFRTAAGRAESPNTNREGTFVIAWGEYNTNDELPFFYVIGNLKTNEGRDTKKTVIENDFCIVIPDLGFYRKHYTPGTKKPSKKEVKGDALYICPLHSPYPVRSKPTAATTQPQNQAGLISSENASSVSREVRFGLL